MSLFRTTTPFLQNNAWLHQSQNALRYNTSQVGSVLPLCFGTVRQQVNLVALGDFMGPGGGKKGKGVGPLPIAGTNTVAGGKGGGGKGKGSKKSQDFSVDLAVALCQGPVTFNGNNLVFANSSVEAFSATASGAGKGTSANQLNFYIGDDGQDITHPVGSVNYSGTCVVTATPIDLGPSPAIPNLSFEINALLYTTGGPAFPVDANPGDVVTAFLTDPRYGAEFPAANLDDLVGVGAGTTLGEYCQTFGLLISVSLDGQQKAAQWLEGISRLLNTAPVCSGELLKFIPYGDIAYAANSAIWVPNLVPVYALTDADFIPWHPHQDGADPEIGQDDPIILTRTNPADAFNWFSIEYLDRANFYNSTVLAVYDQGAIDQYGLRIGDSLPGKCFSSATSAQVAAQLYLQRTQYIRNTYKFQIGWDKALLEPMDIVLLSGSAGDAYLSQEAVRVLSIEENDNGDLTVEAEDVVTGHMSPNPSAMQNTNAAGGKDNEFGILGVGVAGPNGGDPENATVTQTVNLGGNVAILYICYLNDGTLDTPTVDLVSGGGLTWRRRAGGYQLMYPDFGPKLLNSSGHPNPKNYVVAQETWWAPINEDFTGNPATIAVSFSNVLWGVGQPVNAWVGVVTVDTGPWRDCPWQPDETISNANWADEGVNIQLSGMPPGTFVDSPVVGEGIFQIARLAFACGYAIPQYLFSDAVYDPGHPSDPDYATSETAQTIYNQHGIFDFYTIGLSNYTFNPQLVLSATQLKAQNDPTPPMGKTNELMDGLWMQVCGFRVEEDFTTGTIGVEWGNGITFPFTFTPITNNQVDQCAACFAAAVSVNSGFYPYNSCAEGIIGGTGSALGGGIPFPFPAWMFMADALKDAPQWQSPPFGPGPFYAPACGQ
jgi:hypothetical protein